MTNYMIQPWDKMGITDPDTYVPPEVLTVAEEVISCYDMNVDDMNLLTAKSDKGGAIWKIHTNHGNRSLKVLHRVPSRSMFSIYAQDYMVKQGARVPGLVRTKSNELFVNKGGKSWIVTDWVEPLEPVSKIDLEGAKELCNALGEFHRLSRGYQPPLGAYRATRLYRWPGTYTKIYQKIGWFRVLAQAYSDLPGSSELLSVVDLYQEQSSAALSRLRNSSYPKLISRGEPYWGIVHQDYGWSNAQKGPGGMWIIDLDGVTYDLPIRDLRKLIGSTMTDIGVWDIDWIKGMIEAYHEANPIEPELYEVLLTDLSLPNEFYKEVKEIVYDPATFLTQEGASLLTRLEETERSKAPALEQLAQWKGLKLPADLKVEIPSTWQSTLDDDEYVRLGDEQWEIPSYFGPPTASETPLVPALSPSHADSFDQGANNTPTAPQAWPDMTDQLAPTGEAPTIEVGPSIVPQGSPVNEDTTARTMAQEYPLNRTLQSASRARTNQKTKTNRTHGAAIGRTRTAARPENQTLKQKVTSRWDTGKQTVVARTTRSRNLSKKRTTTGRLISSLKVVPSKKRKIVSLSGNQKTARRRNTVGSSAVQRGQLRVIGGRKTAGGSLLTKSGFLQRCRRRVVRHRAVNKSSQVSKSVLVKVNGPQTEKRRLSRQRVAR